MPSYREHPRKFADERYSRLLHGHISATFAGNTLIGAADGSSGLRGNGFDSLALVDFPMLQKLSITIDEISEVGVMTFNNVPLLREVFMNMVLPSFVILPWQQITKFTGESYYVDECLEAIRLMPNLLECAFSAFEFEDGDANRFEQSPTPIYDISPCSKPRSSTIRPVPISSDSSPCLCKRLNSPARIILTRKSSIHS
ncbi:hypothetical protein B0H14DRAFT_477400 [Mycena olivaceomarginata]|nr:hypothetical protein B0H14DRAFT_477400 [Mycena olivaceomarginata]